MKITESDVQILTHLLKNEQNCATITNILSSFDKKIDRSTIYRHLEELINVKLVCKVFNNKYKLSARWKKFIETGIIE